MRGQRMLWMYAGLLWFTVRWAETHGTFISASRRWLWAARYSNSRRTAESQEAWGGICMRTNKQIVTAERSRGPGVLMCFLEKKTFRCMIRFSRKQRRKKNLQIAKVSSFQCDCQLAVWIQDVSVWSILLFGGVLFILTRQPALWTASVITQAGLTVALWTMFLCRPAHCTLA